MPAGTRKGKQPPVSGGLFLKTPRDRCLLPCHRLSRISYHHQACSSAQGEAGTCLWVVVFETTQRQVPAPLLPFVLILLSSAESVARYRALLRGATAPHPTQFPRHTQSPAQSLRARFVSACARLLPSRPLALSPAASFLFAAGSPYGARFCRRAVCFAVRFASPPLPLRSRARAPSPPCSLRLAGESGCALKGALFCRLAHRKCAGGCALCP